MDEVCNIPTNYILDCTYIYSYIVYHFFLLSSFCQRLNYQTAFIFLVPLLQLLSKTPGTLWDAPCAAALRAESCVLLGLQLKIEGSAMFTSKNAGFTHRNTSFSEQTLGFHQSNMVGCFKQMQALISRVAYAVEQGKTQGLYPHKLCLS